MYASRVMKMHIVLSSYYTDFPLPFIFLHMAVRIIIIIYVQLLIMHLKQAIKNKIL